MLNEKLEKEIRERCEKATVGPWVYRPDKYDDWGLVRGGDNRYPVAKATNPTVSNAELDEYRSAKADPYEDNGQFIAHSRTDIPLLLDEISRLRQKEKWIPEMYEALAQANDACSSIVGPEEWPRKQILAILRNPEVKQLLAPPSPDTEGGK